MICIPGIPTEDRGFQRAERNVRVIRWDLGFEVTKWTVKWGDVLRGTSLFIGHGCLSRNFSQTASDWVT